MATNRNLGLRRLPAQPTGRVSPNPGPGVRPAPAGTLGEIVTGTRQTTPPITVRPRPIQPIPRPIIGRVSPNPGYKPPVGGGLPLGIRGTLQTTAKTAKASQKAATPPGRRVGRNPTPGTPRRVGPIAQARPATLRTQKPAPKPFRKKGGGGTVRRPIGR